MLKRSIPKHNLIIIGGDMNARIGKSDAEASVYNAVTNESGRRLLDYIQECGLNGLNTIYRKCKGKLCKHISPKGLKSQIDYALINGKWKNSALNCEAFDNFYTAGSDHRIVTAKVRLSMRENKPSTIKRSQYDWSRLLSDDHIKELYSTEVKNHFEALENLEVANDSMKYTTTSYRLTRKQQRNTYQQRTKSNNMFHGKAKTSVLGEK